jgi:hypothetical protein
MKPRERKCCECGGSADCTIIHPRSIGTYCSSHMEKYITQFGIGTAIIVPTNYLPDDNNFPIPFIRSGKTNYIFGKTEEGYDDWLKQSAVFSPNFNIP